MTKKNVAISGYDPVSYFNKNPLKGKPSINLKSEGVIYYFENEINRNVFMESTNKFTPQYGGWCAYALGEKGELMGIDPKTYKITDGKLYLFYNKFFTNTLNDWSDNEVSLIQKADNNWKKIINGLN